MKAVSVILLISLIIIGSSCATFKVVTTNTEASQIAVANYLAAQKNADLSDEEKIKITITHTLLLDTKS